MTLQSHCASWAALGANTSTPKGQAIPSCLSSHSSPASERQEKWPHSPPHLRHPEMTALKADSSLCLTPSATDAALPAQALSPGPPSPPCPPYLLPTHLCSPGRREWGGSPGAPLPQQVSISSARSGCGQDQNTPQGWHRMLGQGDEQGRDQEEGRQKRKREKEKEKGKREEVGWGRSKGEMER